MPVSVAAVKPSSPRIDEDLLYQARQDAFLLLLALDGLDRDGAYVHETTKVRTGALRGLANGRSGKLARIGRRAAGEPAESLTPGTGPRARGRRGAQPGRP
jgi:hypothetical protein